MKLNRPLHRNQKILLQIYAVSLTAVGLVLLQTILYFPNPFYVIISDSMVPALNIGDVVVLEGVQPQEIGVGDMVAFRPTVKTVADVLVHRVAHVDFDSHGTLLYTTRGDANAFDDPFDVRFSDIEGRVIFVIPRIGQIASVMGNPLVLIILVLFGLRRYF